MKIRPLFAAFALLLAGCDIPGLGPDPRIAQREADAKAIGAACRHAMRGIEDCYGLNEKAAKTAVFEGWKEMDVYMRENKIEGIAPKNIRETKVEQPAEEIIEDKKAKVSSRENMTVPIKPKSDLAVASSRPADKVPAKSSAN